MRLERTRHDRRTTCAALVVAVLLATAAHSSQPAFATDREADAKRLEQQLVAPCCWRQQVAIHDSPVARAIRRDIRVRLTRGESSQRVLDAYVQEYGTAILVEPPAQGLNLALYVLPPVVLLLSGALLVVLLRRFTRPAVPTGEPAAAKAIADAPPEHVRQLENDLDAMN
jgi:cytochrome c-type biogenesis protein CcmH